MYIHIIFITLRRHKTNCNEDEVCGAKYIQIWKAAMSQNRVARSSWFHKKAHDATPKLPAYKSVHLFIFILQFAMSGD